MTVRICIIISFKLANMQISASARAPERKGQHAGTTCTRDKETILMAVNSVIMVDKKNYSQMFNTCKLTLLPCQYLW